MPTRRSLFLLWLPLVASALMLARAMPGIGDEERIWERYRAESVESKRFDRFVDLALHGALDEWAPQELDRELLGMGRVYRRRFRSMFPEMFVPRGRSRSQ